MASRKELLSNIRESIAEIATINQIELLLGKNQTLSDDLFLRRLLLEAEIANTRLTLFSSRNIEGDEI